MNKHLPILFLILTLCAGSTMYAQTDCAISAEKFIQLLHANRDSSESILMPCYTLLADNSKRTVYTWQHHGTGSEYFDLTDVISIEKTDTEFSKLAFITNSTKSYLKVKNGLKALDYKYLKDVWNEADKTNYSCYVKGDLALMIYNSKDDKQQINYTMMIVDKKACFDLLKIN